MNHIDAWGSCASGRRSRAAETVAVKRALLAAGLAVEYVRHGRGTTWGKLRVRLGQTGTVHVFADLPTPSIGCVAGCPACAEWRTCEATARRIIAEVTGYSDNAYVD